MVSWQPFSFGSKIDLFHFILFYFYSVRLECMQAQREPTTNENQWRGRIEYLSTCSVAAAISPRFKQFFILKRRISWTDGRFVDLFERREKKKKTTESKINKVQHFIESCFFLLLIFLEHIPGTHGLNRLFFPAQLDSLCISICCV